MQSVMSLQQTNPDDVAIIPTDEQIANAYRPYMHAVVGESAPAIESESASDALRNASVVELLKVGRPARNRKLLRAGFVALFSAAIVALVAVLLWSPYREA